MIESGAGLIAEHFGTKAGEFFSTGVWVVSWTVVKIANEAEAYASASPDV